MRAISISASVALNDEEQEELLRPFRARFSEIPQGRRLSAEWSEWLLVAKDIGAVVGTANAAITLASHLIGWRRKMAERGKRPAVHLTAEGGDVLDLAEASDADIKQWIGRTVDS